MGDFWYQIRPSYYFEEEKYKLLVLFKITEKKIGATQKQITEYMKFSPNVYDYIFITSW